MLKQQLNLKLSQKLSPQQIQLMKLIQLPTLSFEQKLHRELEENPALEAGKEMLENEDPDNPQEEDREIIETDDINIDEYLSDDEIPAYRLHANNYSQDDEEKKVPYAAGISFTQFLMDQMRTFSMSETESQIARFWSAVSMKQAISVEIYLILLMTLPLLKICMLRRIKYKMYSRKYSNSILLELALWTCKTA